MTVSILKTYYFINLLLNNILKYRKNTYLENMLI